MVTIIRNSFMLGTVQKQLLFLTISLALFICSIFPQQHGPVFFSQASPEMKALRRAKRRNDALHLRGTNNCIAIIDRKISYERKLKSISRVLKNRDYISDPSKKYVKKTARRQLKRGNIGKLKKTIGSQLPVVSQAGEQMSMWQFVKSVLSMPGTTPQRKMAIASSILPQVLNARVEIIICAWYALHKATSPSHFASILTVSLHALFPSDQAFVVELVRAIVMIMGLNGPMSQAGSFLEGWKAIKNDWKAFSKSDLVVRLHTLICYLVTLSGKEKVHVSIGNLSVLSAKAIKHMNLVSLIDFVLSTVHYAIERFAMYLECGNFSDVFLSETSDLEFAKEYAFLLSAISLYEYEKLHTVDSDKSDYEKRLDKCIERCTEMIKVASDKNIKAQLTMKLVQLKKVHVQMISLQHKETMRQAPFGVLLYGSSSIGKSTVCDELIPMMQLAFGFKRDMDTVVSLNDADKYQSEFRTMHNTIIFDDIANSTVQSTTENPTRKLIDFFNNVPKAALKADVESKGRMMIRPSIIIGTTNVKHLNADFWSEEPVSIVRRFNYTVTVTVKREFQKEGGMLDSQRVTTWKNSFPPEERSSVVNDLWDFHIEYVVPVTDPITNKQYPTYVTAVDEHGKSMSCVSIFDLIRFMQARIKEHIAQQDVLLESHKEAFARNLCEHSFYPSHCQECIISQAGIDVDDAEHERLVQQLSELASVIARISLGATRIGNLLSIAPETIETWIDLYMFNGYIVKLISCDVPTLILCITLWFGLIVFIAALQYFSLFVSFILFCFSVIPGYLLVVLSLLYRYGKYVSLLDKYERKFNSTKRMLKSTFVRAGKTVRDNYFILAGSLLAFGVGTCFIWKLLKSSRVDSHGGLVSSLVQAVGEEPVNIWKPVFQSALPCQEEAKNTSFDQLVTIIGKNIATCEFEQYDGVKFHSNVIPVKSNLWVIPKHVAMRSPKMKMKVSTIRKGLVGGSTFVTMFSPEETYSVPNSDFAIVYCPEGGSRKDITKYLPTTYLEREFAATLCYKDPDGELYKENVPARGDLEEIVATEGKFIGCKYTTSKDTFVGLCGAALIADTKTPLVAGFHLGGIGRMGCAGTLLLRHVHDAEKFFSERVLLSHSEGTFRTARMDVDFGPLKNVSERNAAHWLDDDATIEMFGSHNIGTRTFRSNCIPTIISDAVTRHMGVPNDYGPPKKMNHWKHWKNDMDLKTHAHGLFDNEILRKAEEDLLSTALGALTPNWKKVTKPLDDVSVLSGADGIYGIEAVNLKSSMGFPINKSKNAGWFWRSDVPVEGLASEPIETTAEVWREVALMEEALECGKRCYTIQRGNLKDTPTPNNSEKVRVFSGCEAGFLILVRRYFLPICRFIMRHPFVFECAVGINAYGPEWHELTKHVSKFGEERFICGDYSKFDSRMAARIMFVAFRIMVTIASECGYSERDLCIMRGIATEICEPVYEHNGEILKFVGSNPSGQPVTVFLNNFVNSLYLRYAYFAIFSDKQVPQFNEVVSVMCYGDDNVMSVHSEFAEFNHTTVANELAKIGVKYTMADKETESVPFIHRDDASFLKRSFVFSDELGVFVAPIDESSIFKSLHCVLASKVLSRKEQAAEVVKNARREFFLAGRTVYDLRTQQLEEVIDECNLKHFLPPLQSYDALLAEYEIKYKVGLSKARC